MRFITLGPSTSGLWKIQVIPGPGPLTPPKREKPREREWESAAYSLWGLAPGVGGDASSLQWLSHCAAAACRRQGEMPFIYPKWRPPGRGGGEPRRSNYPHVLSPGYYRHVAFTRAFTPRAPLALLSTPPCGCDNYAKCRSFCEIL